MTLLPFVLAAVLAVLTSTTRSMKIFDRDGKTNFVDENNVLLGYDTGQDCCEYADWFIADEPRAEYPEGDLNKPDDLEAFRFDPDWFETHENGSYDGGGVAIFRITDGPSNRFLHIFNAHNGYYGHGFTLEVGGIVKQQGCL